MNDELENLTEMDRIQLRDRQLRIEHEEKRKKHVHEGVAGGSGFSGKLQMKITRATPPGFFQKIKDLIREL